MEHCERPLRGRAWNIMALIAVQFGWSLWTRVEECASVGAWAGARAYWPCMAGQGGWIEFCTGVVIGGKNSTL